MLQFLVDIAIVTVRVVQIYFTKIEKRSGHDAFSFLFPFR